MKSLCEERDQTKICKNLKKKKKKAARKTLKLVLGEKNKNGWENFEETDKKAVILLAISFKDKHRQ